MMELLRSWMASRHRGSVFYYIRKILDFQDQTEANGKNQLDGLREHLADDQVYQLFREAINCPDLREVLVTRVSFQTRTRALIQAVSRDQKNLVVSLLQAGINIAHHKYNALRIALSRTNWQIIRCLMDEALRSGVTKAILRQLVDSSPLKTGCELDFCSTKAKTKRNQIVSALDRYGLMTG